VQEAHTVSHFQRAVLKIGDYLIVLAVALGGVIIVVGLLRHDPVLTTLQFALVLTVAAIPVAMPTVLSVTMGGRRAPAGQKRGDRDPAGGHRGTGGHGRAVLGQDRHPDQNKLTLGDPFSVDNVPAEQVILCAALASRAEDQDTIDMAVLAGLKDGQALKAISGPFPAVRPRA